MTYAVLVGFSVFFSVGGAFSNSQMGDQRYPTLIDCERAKPLVLRQVTEIAQRAAGAVGARAEINSVRCVKL